MMIKALWAAFRFWWVYGKQATRLVEAIYVLIEHMTSPDEKREITLGLNKLIVEQEPKPLKVERLATLHCRAWQCKLG